MHCNGGVRPHLNGIGLPLNAPPPVTTLLGPNETTFPLANVGLPVRTLFATERPAPAAVACAATLVFASIMDRIISPELFVPMFTPTVLFVIVLSTITTAAPATPAKLTPLPPEPV